MSEEAWSRRRGSFGGAAQAYAYGRPSYPVEALRWSLPDGAHRVLDLAAGTGKLSETLLELGLEVVAVEPLDEMRALVPAAAQALAGTAEEIPLGDASVDAVVVGQAFHWFDATRALAEMRRVLRPGGTIGLFWNLDDDRTAWVDELCRVTSSEARASLVPQQQPSSSPIPDGAGFAQVERAMFAYAESYDADRLVAAVASRSVTILLPDDERDALLARVRELAPQGRFDFPMMCEAWRAVAVKR